MIELLRGGIGGLVFRQMPDGTIILSGAHRLDKRKATKKQKAHRQCFRQAAQTARRLAHEHPIHAELAKGTWKSAYNFALSDWWQAPVIHGIKQQKGQILVEATDNMMVAGVRLTIRNEQGEVIESREASKGKVDWWKFTHQTEGRSILAEAWDLPQHVTKFVLK